MLKQLQSLKPPSSTPGQDKNLRPPHFCKKFNSEQLSFESFFDTIGIFGSVQKWIYFPIPVHYKYIKNGKLWSPPVPLLGEIEICVHYVFSRKFNSQQFLFDESKGIGMRSKSSLSHNSTKSIFIQLIFSLLITSFFKITSSVSYAQAWQKKRESNS